MFGKGDLLDMWLYSSTGPSFFEDDPDLKLLWHEKEIRLCEEGPRHLSLQYPLNSVSPWSKQKERGRIKRAALQT
jgi:hypothetical protein